MFDEPTEKEILEKTIVDIDTIPIEEAIKSVEKEKKEEKVKTIPKEKVSLKEIDDRLMTIDDFLDF